MCTDEGNRQRLTRAVCVKGFCGSSEQQRKDILEKFEKCTAAHMRDKDESIMSQGGQKLGNKGGKEGLCGNRHTTAAELLHPACYDSNYLSP